MAKKLARAKEPPNPSSSSSSSLQLSLETLVEDHSLFFDKLVTFIPPRFYLSSPDANPDDEKPWYQGLSKAARASAQKESRKNLKIARLQRFNPETASSTLEIVQQQRPSSSTAEPSDAAPVTYEELRQRLHQRLQDLRSKRNTRTTTTDRRKKEPEITDDRSKKRKIHSAPVLGASNDKEDEQEEKNDVMYGKVKVGDEDDMRGRKKKKKKVSKFRELERAEKLAEMKKDPEKAEKVSWKAAESRATGVKVHDDPRILKESIKKDKKRQKKSAEKWKERVQSTESKKRDRQNKRSENIKERIQQKKMRRIEKREKKLMRPGFEGRKEGYINE